MTDDADFMLQAFKWLAEQGAEAEAGAGAGGGEQQVAANRRLLANRLNRLAKLSSEHSRQLLHSLRASLAMDQTDFSRFRALRLIRPTSELGGRFTCSVSSLDGDDLRSTRLVVYGK